jgi:hypothetical protein
LKLLKFDTGVVIDVTKIVKIEIKSYEYDMTYSIIAYIPYLSGIELADNIATKKEAEDKLDLITKQIMEAYNNG